MSRVGINPARGKISSYKPARVSICIITYIPEESGYFEQRLDVIKLLFSSLQAHTSPPYDLLVFDNGSCPELVAYLQSQKDAGLISYLILSQKNIGKIGALRILFQAAPGEIIAYSDDDIFYYPGWLEAHLDILDNFPQAGMVSGLPVRNAARHANRSIKRIFEQPLQGIRVTKERYIPDEWEIDWAVSTGRDSQAHLADSAGELDMLFHTVDRQGNTLCTAVGSANHFQFAGRRELLLQALPKQWSGKLMGAMIELDEAMDDLGFLRLSTSQRYVRHMGNAISPELLKTAREYQLIQEDGFKAGQPSVTPESKTNKKRRGFFLIPGSRRVLSWLYHRLFKILYG